MPSGGNLAITPAADTQPVLDVATVVEGTVTLSTPNPEGWLYLGYYDTCSSPTVTVASGGSFNIATDGDPTDGYSAVNYYGCDSIDVQSGGTLAKTGGTGTSTLYDVQTIISGNLKATTGTLDSDPTLDPGADLSGDVMPYGATVTVNDDVTVQSGQNWLWTGADIYGSGQLTIASGGNLSITPSADTQPVLDVATVVDGTVTLSTPNPEGWLYLGYYDTCSSPTVTVASGGSFNIATDGDPTDGYSAVNYYGCDSIDVQSGGTLAKTGGTGTSTLYDVQTIISGNLKATTGTLDSDPTLDPGADLSGDVLPSGATVTVNEDVTVQSGQNWLWTGADITGSGQLTVASGGNLAITPSADTQPILDLAMVVDGTVTLSTPNPEGWLYLGYYDTCSSPTVTVASGGSFNIATDGDPTDGYSAANYYGCDSIDVQSGGTLAKTGGTGTSTLVGATATVTGLVDAPSGTLNLGNLTNLSGGTLTGGTYDAGTPTTAGTIDINGYVTTNDATVSVVGSGSSLADGSDSALSGLTTNGAQGSIDTSDGASLPAGGDLANAGSLIGSGTITTTGLTNTGLVEAIDGGPAILSDSGDYTQSGAGNLEVAFNGTGAHQASELMVAGTATLGGTLTVATGFTPSVGNSFTLLTATSHTGQFALVDWPGLPAGLGYSVNYANAGQVTVSVVNAPAALPVVTGLSTQTGPGTGNTTVTVTGSHFTGATAVDFGGVPATGVDVAGNGNSLTAVSPAGVGIVDVQVVTSAGNSQPVSADKFSYGPVITSVSPAQGTPYGGNTVTITGGGFADVTGVKFGTTPATDVDVVSTGSITATVPAGTGTVDVRVVTSAYGTSAVTGADQYRYGLQVVFDPPVSDLSINAGGTTPTLTVELVDPAGNPGPAPSGGQTLSLTTTSAVGSFSQSGSPVTQLVIPAGDSTASFQYSDSRAAANHHGGPGPGRHSGGGHGHGDGQRQRPRPVWPSPRRR